MSLAEYRASPSEQQRTSDLFALVPASGRIALDVGARDGYYSLMLAERFDKVIALDLTMPDVVHPKVECVEGNAANLELPDNSVDFVLCAEVLEHIPMPTLTAVCREMERVTAGKILIGVPYRQDTRIGRTTCYSCMGRNPPWGHVNVFDEQRLAALFPASTVASTTYVGENAEHTNALACGLMDLAGNPFGTYFQLEPCIHCGAPLRPPPERNFAQRVLTRVAVWSEKVTGSFAKPRRNWIHTLFSTNASA